MRAFGAMGDAAGVDDVAEQAQIGKIESHRITYSFVFHEVRFNILPIVIGYFNAILSRSAKSSVAMPIGSAVRCIAASERIG
jgi:hypothetical protein